MMTQDERIDALTAKVNQLALSYGLAQRDLGIDEQYVLSILARLHDVRRELSNSRDGGNSFVVQLDKCIKGEPLGDDFESEPIFLRLQEALDFKTAE